MSVHAHATPGVIRAHYEQRMQAALQQAIRDAYTTTRTRPRITGHQYALDSGTRMLGRAWTGTAAFGADRVRATGKGRY